MSDQNNQGNTTNFQEVAERAVLGVLDNTGLRLKDREVRWIGEPAIVLTAGDFEIWLYVDEAAISKPVDRRYEKWDYAQQEQLIDHLASDLRYLMTNRESNPA